MLNDESSVAEIRNRLRRAQGQPVGFKLVACGMRECSSGTRGDGTRRTEAELEKLFLTLS